MYEMSTHSTNYITINDYVMIKSNHITYSNYVKSINVQG